MADGDFQTDAEVNEAAQRFADSCTAHFARFSPDPLDFSLASVERVEAALGRMVDELSALRPGPGEEDINRLSTLFGSYLGETYRRNFGGDWGLSGGDLVSFRTPAGAVCFPVARVWRRIQLDDASPVHHWFMALRQHDLENPPGPESPAV